jgi:glyoxylase-like metal-dependent hydrolase (beta-lactamase superfamily II)
LNHLFLIDEDLPNLFFISGENKGKYPNSNSLLFIISDKKGILFDTGIGHNLIKKLLSKFKISKVFISHWHEDHISGNYLFNKDKVDFFSHPLDARILRNIDKFQVFYETVGTSVESHFQELLTSMKLESMRTIQYLENYQEIKVGNSLIMKVLHTPGHSAGHCCFFEPKSRLIFLADIDLSRLGPWYGCLDSNLEDFEKSIQILIDMDLNYAISGHKGIIIGKTEIRNQLKKYLAVINLRDQKILDKLSENKPKVINDLIGKNIVYKRYNFMKDYLLIAEKQMLSKHIFRLIERKKISMDGEGFILC